MLTHDELCQLVAGVHFRFTYISDIEKYGKHEKWEGFGDIPEGNFAGDCEMFAQAVRKELDRLGQKSRLATCGVNSDTINHCVCVYDNWVIDNIHQYPVPKSDLMTYKFIAISGFKAGDAWHEVI